MDIYSGFRHHRSTGPVFLTIGNFDGVHRGHQMLICDLAASGRMRPAGWPDC